MKEIIFHIALYTYPGLAIIYGFWAILHFGAKNTMSIEMRTGSTYPDWLTGLHFLCQSVAFYLLYFATKDLPINTSAFSFIIRMWWAAAFLIGLTISIWHFAVLADRQRTMSKMSKMNNRKDEDQADG